MADVLSEIDRLKLRVADLQAALAQTGARLAEALYEIEKLKLMRAYDMRDGESVSIDTGLITRKRNEAEAPR